MSQVKENLIDLQTTIPNEVYDMFDTRKKDKKGKEIRREFPVMFSIADRARKHKDKKAGKK